MDYYYVDDGSGVMLFLLLFGIAVGVYDQIVYLGRHLGPYIHKKAFLRNIKKEIKQQKKKSVIINGIAFNPELKAGDVVGFVGDIGMNLVYRYYPISQKTCRIGSVIWHIRDLNDFLIENHLRLEKM